MFTGVNSGAIANLSRIIKVFVIHSHDKFLEFARDMLWLNVTIHKQSELYMVIRQLEFGVLQLTQQLSEMMDAIQSILLGKFKCKPTQT
jgi:hypothetical protein